MNLAAHAVPGTIAGGVDTKAQRLPRGRLAPSPTGALHVGNARSFLLAWLSIRSRGGVVVLRIEDLDHPKVRPHAADGALDDLRWLGLDWDEGPDVGGPHAPYIQSERMERYAETLARLRELGRVYPCVCSRRDVETAQSAPHAEDESPRYSGVCRERFADYAAARAAMPPGRLPAWRFRVEPDETTEFDDLIHGPQRETLFETVGDFAISRHPRGAGYMVSVVTDDAAMGITEAMRGDDLLAATHRQLALYGALRLQPPRFAHVPLIVGTDGRRLAKRHGDTRISAFRERGVDPRRLVGFLAWSCGVVERNEPASARELIERYRSELLSRRPFVWDETLDHGVP